MNNIGTWTLARLLAGLSPDGVDVNVLGDPWATLVRAVSEAARDGGDRRAAFEAALAAMPDLDKTAIYKAILQVDPGGPCPGSRDVSEDSLPDAATMPALLGIETEEVDPTAGQWLTDYVTFASKASPMTPASFHETLGLFALSVAVARRVCLRVSTTAIYPNVYAMLIAPSTLFRKTTALNLTQAVIRMAGLDRTLLAPLQTPESLLGELSTRKPATFAVWGTEEQDAWRAERAFAAQRGWILEEGSRLLDSFNRDYSAGLLPLVLALFDCPDREVYQTVGRGRQVVANAYLNILGATTPASMRVHLANPQHWANGLWARFVLVTPDGDLPPWAFWPDPMDIPANLAGHLHCLGLERLPVPVVDQDEATGEVVVKSVAPKTIVLAEGVWQAWETYSKVLSYDLLKDGQVDERLFACYGRLPATAIKIAMLLACSDWPEQDAPTPAISLPHWTRALAITEGWRASLHRLVAATQADTEQELEQKVIGIVSRTGNKGLTAREVGRLAHCNRSNIEPVLEYLARDGLLDAFTPDKGKARRYRPSVTSVTSVTLSQVSQGM